MLPIHVAASSAMPCRVPGQRRRRPHQAAAHAAAHQAAAPHQAAAERACQVSMPHVRVCPGALAGPLHEMPCPHGPRLPAASTRQPLPRPSRPHDLCRPPRVPMGHCQHPARVGDQWGVRARIPDLGHQRGVQGVDHGVQGGHGPPQGAQRRAGHQLRSGTRACPCAFHPGQSSWVHTPPCFQGAQTGTRCMFAHPVAAPHASSGMSSRSCAGAALAWSPRSLPAAGAGRSQAAARSTSMVCRRLAQL